MVSDYRLVLNMGSRLCSPLLLHLLTELSAFLIVSPPFPALCFLLKRRRVFSSGNDRYLGRLGLADFPFF